MKKLNKEQLEKKAALLKELTDRGGDLEDAVTAYNVVITDINDFISEIHDLQEEFFDSRSEKWQESENGDTYANWKEQWDTTLEEQTFEPDDNYDTFEQLPSEIEE